MKVALIKLLFSLVIILGILELLRNVYFFASKAVSVLPF